MIYMVRTLAVVRSDFVTPSSPRVSRACFSPSSEWDHFITHARHTTFYCFAVYAASVFWPTILSDANRWRILGVFPPVARESSDQHHGVPKNIWHKQTTIKRKVHIPPWWRVIDGTSSQVNTLYRYSIFVTAVCLQPGVAIMLYILKLLNLTLVRYTHPVCYLLMERVWLLAIQYELVRASLAVAASIFYFALDNGLFYFGLSERFIR